MSVTLSIMLFALLSCILEKIILICDNNAKYSLDYRGQFVTFFSYWPNNWFGFRFISRFLICLVHSSQTFDYKPGKGAIVGQFVNQ